MLSLTRMTLTANNPVAQGHHVRASGCGHDFRPLAWPAEFSDDTDTMKKRNSFACRWAPTKVSWTIKRGLGTQGNGRS